MSKLLAHCTEASDRTADVIIKENTTFESLLLPAKLLTTLKENGFIKPSPIQLKALPMGRCGFDLIVQSKSGTGKTLIFTLIALENVDVKKEEVQVVIVAPAREIAVQIQDVIKTLGCCIAGLQVHSFIGGMSVAEDKEKCKNCNIAVGTPGRLKHLINEKLLLLNSVRLFVLDEVDKLTETNFLNDINEIYNNLPSRKQIITTSATYPDELKQFLSQYMLSPTFISAESNSPLLLGLKQFVKIVEPYSNVVQEMKWKTDVLVNILSKISFTQCLIFSNYQTRTESISNILNQKGWNTTFISAAQSQKERLIALNSLKEFKCRILLSTDLTARGIDAANVDLVINFDIPADAMTYLHRMGRAGRYGSSGICVNLADRGKDLVHLQNILGCIGGAELKIPILPEFTGSLMDLFNFDSSENEYISAVVSDNIEDAMRDKILELKATKYDISKSKTVNEKKINIQSKKSKKKESITNETHIMDILNDNNEIEKVKKQIDKLDANDILESLASGNFDFEMNETVITGKNEDVQRDTTPTNLYDTAETEDHKHLLASSVCTSNIYIEDREVNKNISKSMDTTEEVFCKNKALLAVSKILDSQISHSEDICDYLNQLKNKEKENLHKITRNDMTFENLEQPERHFEVLCNLKEPGNLDNFSNVNEMNTSDVSNTKQNEIKEEYDIENIFQVGYESIVKSDGETWKTWLTSKQGGCDDSNIDEETAEEGKELDVDTNLDVEIMKWVPVNKAKTKNLDIVQDDTSNGTNMDWVSIPKNTETHVRQSCVVEANCVNNYEHFYDYFEECSNNLWQNGISFESIENFDDWFAYEWEAQLHSVRNYVQQNIYIQEMSKFQNSLGSGNR